MNWQKTSDAPRSTLNRASALLAWLAATCLALAPLPAQESVPVPPAIPVPPAAPTAPAEEIEKAADEIDSKARESRRSRSSEKYTYRELVMVGKDATLKEGEHVREMVVVGGNATVDGTVHGELVVVGGHLKMGSNAVVKRDLVLVLSGQDIHPNAQVHGARTLVGGSLGVFRLPLVQWPQQWFRKGLLWARPLPHQYAWSWAVAGAALLLFVVVGALFPRQIQASVTALEERAGAALLTGLLGILLFPFAMFILITTGIGLVAVPFVLCAAFAAFVFGQVAVYRFAGQQAGAQAGLSFLQHPLAALLAGTLLFYLLYTVPILGFIVWGAVVPLGLGAVLLAAFQRAPRAGGSNGAAMAAAGIPMAGIPVAGAAYPASAAPGPSAPVESGATALWPRAGFWWRTLASLLDLVLVGLVAAVVFHARKFFLLFWVAYLLSLWSWKGTTVGGLVCGLKIVHTDGRRMDFAAALLRLLGSFFSLAALGLGFFWAGWSRDKQSWHDKMAGTVLVRAPRGHSLL